MRGRPLARTLWTRAARACVPVFGLFVLSGPVQAQEVGSGSSESRSLARAATAERAGRVEEARRELEAVLDVNPTSSAALAMLSQLLTTRGRSSEVLPRAESAAAAGGLGDPVVMQVWIRALDSAGQRDSALSLATDWIRRKPTDVAAYAERARLLAAAGRIDEAKATLVDGRTAKQDSTLLSQELAELMVSTGDFQGAAREWIKILGWGEIGVAAVAERISAAGFDSGEATSALAEAVSDPSLPVHVRRGGLGLALALDDRDWARQIARDLAASVPAETRRLLLRDYYVECRNREWSDEASWAAARLEEESLDEAERRHWRAMRADVAFRAGDQEAAERTFAELSRTASPGTETHRRSLRRLFSLRVAGRSDEAVGLLSEYAAAYPEDTDEVVDMAVELSNSRVANRDLEGARAALGSAPDLPTPSQASRLAGQAAVVALLEGRPAVALAELETAIFLPGGDPVRRTDAILLAQLLEAADSSDVARFGEGLLDLLADRDPDSLVRRAEHWGQSSMGEAGAALLSIAAGALDREGFPAEAARLRRELVDSFPQAPETPAAMLELGRHAGRADPDEARQWFERLVVTYPRHALAPLARQELSTLSGGE